MAKEREGYKQIKEGSSRARENSLIAHHQVFNNVFSPPYMGSEEERFKKSSQRKLEKIKTIRV